MKKSEFLKRQKIGKVLLSVIVLVIGLLVFIVMLQPSNSSEKRFQNELLNVKCHQVDVNCFYFDAFDKELFCLLKAFKNQHPELQIEGIFRSGNGAFVTFSLQKREKN